MNLTTYECYTCDYGNTAQYPCLTKVRTTAIAEPETFLQYF